MSTFEAIERAELERLLGREIPQAVSSFKLKIFAPRPSQIEPLIGSLRQLGFGATALDSSASTESNLSLVYGGAPPEVRQVVSEVVRLFTGEQTAQRKAWSDTDHDVYLYLPATVSALLQPVGLTREAFGMSGWLAQQSPRQGGPLLEVQGDRVRIGNVWLPRGDGRSPLVPNLDEVARDHCLDSQSAQLLEDIARAVSCGEPVMLEGVTASSKTSSIRFLAALTRTPLLMLSLSGQSDSAELIGKFVPAVAPPDPGPAATPTAMDKKRGEHDQHGPGLRWVWQDGAVTTALRQGLWLVLDEANLAETALLERLNQVLEQRRLVLSELDNRVIVAHPGFHLFSCGNPTSYAGRAPTSPAWRDRWYHRQVSAPTESCYQEMLSFLVQGQAPAVEVSGVRYEGVARPPRFPSLAALPGIERFLTALAKLQSMLDQVTAAEADDNRLGRDRRERYVFTRRALWSVLRSVDTGIQSGLGAREAEQLAVWRTYVDRIAGLQDRTTVLRLIEAAGLGARPDGRGVGYTDELPGDGGRLGSWFAGKR